MQHVGVSEEAHCAMPEQGTPRTKAETGHILALLVSTLTSHMGLHL